MPEVLANLVYLVAQIPNPLNALQIIVIDMGFELFVALTYAWEVPESRKKGLMTHIPRKPVTPRSIGLLLKDEEIAKQKKKQIDKWVFGEEQSYRQNEAQEDEDEVEKKEPFHLRIKRVFAHIRYWFTHLLDRDQWKHYLTPREGDVLISNGIQSWAYLEAGLIETVGCFLVYFLVFYNLFNESGRARYYPSDVVTLGQKAPEDWTADQKKVIQAASSAYFLGILIQQAFNVFICKVTLRLPFGKMLFRNLATPLGLSMGILLSMFFVYPQFMWSSPFATHYVFPGYWLIPMASGAVLLLYATVRILFIRSRQPQNINMALPLDLHPTRWSTKSA
jgi:sodium/potassium-transporting ATPase subunit alpha